eukprot:4216563-Alexandrium_andersonii.AAC.1
MFALWGRPATSSGTGEVFGRLSAAGRAKGDRALGRGLGKCQGERWVDQPPELRAASCFRVDVGFCQCAHTG